jgi:hypothetical protein
VLRCGNVNAKGADGRIGVKAERDESQNLR